MYKTAVQLHGSHNVVGAESEPLVTERPGTVFTRQSWIKSLQVNIFAQEITRSRVTSWSTR